MPKPSNPLAQGGPKDQICNRHISTEAWVRDQQEEARLGTIYENQPYQGGPGETKPILYNGSAQIQQPAPAQATEDQYLNANQKPAPVQDPVHTHLPVSQYNAHMLQGPERKPSHHQLSTTQYKELP